MVLFLECCENVKNNFTYSLNISCPCSPVAVFFMQYSSCLKLSKRKTLEPIIKIIFPSSSPGFGQWLIILKNYLTAALCKTQTFPGRSEMLPIKYTSCGRSRLWGLQNNDVGASRLVWQLHCSRRVNQTHLSPSLFYRLLFIPNSCFTGLAFTVAC